MKKSEFINNIAEDLHRAQHYVAVAGCREHPHSRRLRLEAIACITAEKLDKQLREWWHGTYKPISVALDDAILSLPEWKRWVKTLVKNHGGLKPL